MALRTSLVALGHTQKLPQKYSPITTFYFVAAGHITMIRELEPLSAVVALGHIIPCGLQPQDGLAPQKSVACSHNGA